MIYLDNAATTRISEKVLEAMKPYLTDQFGNAGAIYRLGSDARRAINHARQQVAEFMNAESEEQIVFTSGGSEANTLAIVGSALANYGTWKNASTAFSPIEHESTVNAHGIAQRILGTSVPHLHHSVLRTGLLDFQKTGCMRLISVMAANNEVPMRYPVSELAEEAHNIGALFHTDCVQYAAVYKPDVQELGCDFASISSHKLHGPKGAGALYVRRRTSVHSVIAGSVQQEFGLRGGTENVAAIVGFGAACELTQKKAAMALAKVYNLNAVFRREFTTFAKGVRISHVFNGKISDNPKIISLSIPGVDAQTLVLALSQKDVVVSAGSACNGQSVEPSRVLKALGLLQSAMSTIRISLDESLTEQDMREAAKEITKTAAILMGVGGNV